MAPAPPTAKDSFPDPDAAPPRPGRRTGEDHEMDRFERAGLQRFSARQSLIAVWIAAVILVLAAGGSLKKQADEMHPGLGRDLMTAFAAPASSVANLFAVQHAANKMTGWIHPNPVIGTAGAFTDANSVSSYNGVPPVEPSNFDPLALGAKGPARKQLHTMLVTGDSMSQTFGQAMSQLLEPKGVNVIQDPHLGTAISSTIIVNWGAEATYQVKKYHPQAVVMFIGANEGWAMTGPGGRQVTCCSVQWTTMYAQRVRQIMNTFRQSGAARVYWLLLPALRQKERQAIAKVVNAAFDVAAEPWANQVRIINTIPTISPGDRYTDSLKVGGQQTIIRQSDGVHLNDAGALLASKLVLGYVSKDFNY